MRKFCAFIFMAAAILGSFTACKGSDTQIVVMGSTSVQPYAELLAEEYEHTHRVRIDVTGGGSSAGISAAHTGKAHIGMSSKNLSDKDKEGLEEVVIAVDGLAVIINPNNPVIKNTGDENVDFSIEQVRKIYSGEITNWSELGGGKADIHVITREDGSGTRTAFEDFIMKDPITGKYEKIMNTAVVSSANGFIRYLVSDDANAIGFISLGLVEEQSKDGGTGGGCARRNRTGNKPVVAVSLDGVAATEENVENGSYKLSRPFIFLTRGEPEGLAKDFIEFVTGPAGKKILRDKGLIA